MVHTIAHESNFPVIICGGKYNGEYTREEILKMEISGWTKDYSLEREERKKFGFPNIHREELDCQPRLKDYIGPMWDGDRLRYESPEVNDILSR